MRAIVDAHDGERNHGPRRHRIAEAAAIRSMLDRSRGWSKLAPLRNGERASPPPTSSSAQTDASEKLAPTSAAAEDRRLPEPPARPMSAPAAAVGVPSSRPQHHGVGADTSASEVPPLPLIGPEEGAERVAETEAKGPSPESGERGPRKEPNWFVVVLVSAILGALVLQVVTMGSGPLVHAISSLFGGSTTPTEQFDQIAADMQKDGFTVTKTAVAFEYGPKVQLMVLTPDNPESSTRSAELRVYSIPAHGHVKELFSFRPRLIDSALRTTDPLRHLWTPQTFGIRVRRLAALNGGVGEQALIDLYNPQEPNLEVLPLMLSQNSSNGTFSLVPLLSPRSIGTNSMTSRLSSKYLHGHDWANEARTGLYGRPLKIENADQPSETVRSYAVTQYGVSTRPASGTSGGGVLTLAAGYAVKGGDVPTPTVLQILVWRIDLTGITPRARTFAAIPQFLPLDPSASPDRVQHALTRAAHLLPPTPITAH